MKGMTTQALSTKEKSFKILDSLSVSVKVRENSFDLPLEAVFSMAARNNPKRSYLFVSKLIGKHIPVYPSTPFAAGFILASGLAQALGLPVAKHLISEAVDMLVSNRMGKPSASKQSCSHAARPGELGASLEERILKLPCSDVLSKFNRVYHLPGRALFVGFAETATALGHAVFSCFAGEHRYLHTTRENLAGSFDTLYFTEEHCHAPEQRCLISDIDLVKDNEVLVLIDDEVTSGNTCLDIIKTVHGKYPQPKYVVLTILDWRNDKALQKYSRAEQELGTRIQVLALMRGRFESKGTSPVLNNSLAFIDGANYSAEAVHMLHLPMIATVNVRAADAGGGKARYLGYTGRFGLDGRQNNRLHDEARVLGQRLARRREGNKTLCLGTGEFMYLPFLVAGFMGEGVWVQSTTRSPVHPHLREDYGVKYAITFEDPMRSGVPNFVYNIPPHTYDEVFVFWERKVLPGQVVPLVRVLRQAGIPNITFVYFCD